MLPAARASWRLAHVLTHERGVCKKIREQNVGFRRRCVCRAVGVSRAGIAWVSIALPSGYRVRVDLLTPSALSSCFTHNHAPRAIRACVILHCRWQFVVSLFVLVIACLPLRHFTGCVDCAPTCCAPLASGSMTAKGHVRAPCRLVLSPMFGTFSCLLSLRAHFDGVIVRCAIFARAGFEASSYLAAVLLCRCRHRMRFAVWTVV